MSSNPGLGLPSGTVTFLFTDIEGSTELLKRLGRDRYESVLAEQAGVLRAAVAAYGGRVVDTQGDSLFCAFRSAREGVSAAIEAQRELALHEWPEQVRVRVRMGLHSGEPKAGEERYVGIGVHRAARIGAAAHGGQVLVSETARALVSDDLPAGVSLRDLGVHRLKDIDEPVRLYQVVAAGLEDRFPAPRTLPPGRRRRARLGLVVAVLVVAGAAAAGVLLATGSATAEPRLVANSIAVIDPKSGKPVGDVPLGFSPTDVDAGGDRIWVLNGFARTATAIDPSTLRVVQTVGVDGAPDSQYAIGGREWVGFPGGVDEIDSSGVAKITLWRPPTYRLLCVRHGARSERVGVGRAKRRGARRGERERSSQAAAAGRAGCPAGHYLLRPPLHGWSTARDSRLRLLDRNRRPELRVLHAGRHGHTPLVTEITSPNWAAGFGSYWIGSFQPVNTHSLQSVNVLKRLDPVSGQVMSQTVNAVGQRSLTVDPASGVWGFGGRNLTARLLHIDPRSGQITGTTPLHHTPCCPNAVVGNGIAVGHGRLWVGLDSP